MSQAYLFCCSLVSTYTKHTLVLSLLPQKTQDLAFILSFGLENSNHAIFRTLKPLNILEITLLFVSLFLNTEFVRFS